MPVLNNRVGIGANFARASIGVTNQYTAELAYAYRIPAPRGHLNLGLMTSIRNFQMNFWNSRAHNPLPMMGPFSRFAKQIRSQFRGRDLLQRQNFYRLVFTSFVECQHRLV